MSSRNAAGDDSRLSAEFSVFVPPAAAGEYEEDSPAVVLAGPWGWQASDEASAGRYAQADVPGSTLQFTFEGDSVVLYRGVHEAGGQAQVSFDGEPRGTLELTTTTMAPLDRTRSSLFPSAR